MDDNTGGTAIVLEKWDYPLQELYRIALSFYRQNSGKALHLSYEDNLKLIAFKQQAIIGPFDEKRAPALGVLDVIGRDRRLYWQTLGDMTKERAMEGFIDLLDAMCSAFRPYVEAVKQNRDETLKAELRKMEEVKLERENREKKQQYLLEESYKEEVQRRQLQDALNKQTYQQFKNYAEKQFPGNPEQQAVLIHQLQQEHYHQYMQQIHIQNLGSTSSAEVIDGAPPVKDLDSKEGTIRNAINETMKITAVTVEGNVQEEKINDADDDDYVLIRPAKIWTRPDIVEFKAEVSSGDGDGVINIGHGDTVTVRVPTHANGKCIFWEFATDNYDIGFGIYFEWSKPVTNEVTVHVSDSDDDEEFADDDYISTTDDLECGSLANDRNALGSTFKAPISIIVPIYRRECYNEVYVGSHAYPGEGVYLLKFDNSYSIWRSKRLYYRVYYER